MVRVTRPGGLIYVSFTNWLSPWGGHEWAPWHYLGAERARARYRRRTGRPAKHTLGENLFAVHIGPTLRQVRARDDVTVVSARSRYWPFLAEAVARAPGTPRVRHLEPPPHPPAVSMTEPRSRPRPPAARPAPSTPDPGPARGPAVAAVAAGVLGRGVRAVPRRATRAGRPSTRSSASTHRPRGSSCPTWASCGTTGAASAASRTSTSATPSRCCRTTAWPSWCSLPGVAGRAAVDVADRDGRLLGRAAAGRAAGHRQPRVPAARRGRVRAVAGVHDRRRLDLGRRAARRASCRGCCCR